MVTIRGRVVREFGIDVHTLLCFKCITNKGLLQSTGNSSQWYVAAWTGGELGGERIQVYVWLSPSAMDLKVSQLCQYKTKS